MSLDIITIGDAMRDIFVFPEASEMEIESTSNGFEKSMVFGLGDKVTIADAEDAIGGTAANVAVGLSKLGLKTGIISAIGADNAGEDIKKTLASAKVETSNIKVYKNQKSSFSVIVSYKGERTIFVYHAFGPENFSLPKELNTKWLYLGPMKEGFERLYTRITAAVVQSDIKIAVNPGARQIREGLHAFGGLLKLISVIFLNRQEAQDLAGIRGVTAVKDLAKIIQAQGPQIVAITDGPDGAYAYNGVDFFRVGAYPGHRVDSTGAGDAFASGFIAALFEQGSLMDCLKWGVVNSASVIEENGAQESLLGKNSIKRRVKEYRWPADTLRYS